MAKCDNCGLNTVKTEGELCSDCSKQKERKVNLSERFSNLPTVSFNKKEDNEQYEP